MNRVVALIVAVLLFTATEHLAAQVNPQPADVLFLHGNIYTVNDKQPQAEAIAVKDGKIIFVGSNADAANIAGRARGLSISAAKPSFPA